MSDGQSLKDAIDQLQADLEAAETERQAILADADVVAIELERIAVNGSLSEIKRLSGNAKSLDRRLSYTDRRIAKLRQQLAVKEAIRDKIFAAHQRQQAEKTLARIRQTRHELRIHRAA